ncbi:hypothetical protein HK105_200279 [Polyrhizophydium stewartii]|uniref:N-acetyltransferase domain-containing protein n=1 Tax=Polyrhizophydium stewartii TaxID=2732419 RepID=A0ABR4NL16_9FUNG
MTASEPLSLEQEYAMCESWREDNDKCTFIVLSRDMPANRHGPMSAIAGMIGDVNLFFNDTDNRGSAEVELMIAGIKHLAVTHYTAKISLTNASSRALFAKLGFVEVSVSEIFQEVTLECVLDADRRAWIEQQAGGYESVEV